MLMAGSNSLASRELPLFSSMTSYTPSMRPLSPSMNRNLRTLFEVGCPYYSVPERWIRIAEIPLNNNGKADKTQLKAVAVEHEKSTEEIAHNEAKSTRSDLSIDTLGSKLDTRKSSDFSSVHTLAIPEKVASPDHTTTRHVVPTPQNFDLDKAYMAKNLKTHALIRSPTLPNIPPKITLPELKGSPTAI